MAFVILLVWPPAKLALVELFLTNPKPLTVIYVLGAVPILFRKMKTYPEKGSCSKMLRYTPARSSMPLRKSVGVTANRIRTCSVVWIIGITPKKMREDQEYQGCRSPSCKYAFVTFSGHQVQ